MGSERNPPKCQEKQRYVPCSIGGCRRPVYLRQGAVSCWGAGSFANSPGASSISMPPFFRGGGISSLAFFAAPSRLPPFADSPRFPRPPCSLHSRGPLRPAPFRSLALAFPCLNRRAFGVLQREP